MSDIKIMGFNEKASNNDGSQWSIHFTLSGLPDQAWRAEFEAIKNRNKNQQVVITSVSLNANKELIVVAFAKLTAQQIHDQLKKLVELTNQAQGGFKK